jgi:hypothetical protein
MQYMPSWQCKRCIQNKRCTTCALPHDRLAALLDIAALDRMPSRAWIDGTCDSYGCVLGLAAVSVLMLPGTRCRLHNTLTTFHVWHTFRHENMCT